MQILLLESRAQLISLFLNLFSQFYN
jgi:hypothetical protein